MRQRTAADFLNFYRTQNGTEVDFIMNGAMKK